MGKLTVDALLAKGAHVRILTRDAARAKATFAQFGERPEFEIATGDIETLDGLEAALKGVERLFLLTLSRASQPATERAAVEQAKAAGVKHVVKLSVHGASPSEPNNSLYRWHYDSENAVIASGVAHTILRPNLFLQNFARDDAQLIKTQGKFFKPAAVISHVDVRDIADVAATVLTEDIEKHNGQTYFITGPEGLSYEQVAERISQAIGKKVDFVPLDDVAFYQALVGNKLPVPVAHMLVKLFQTYATNSLARPAGDTQIVTGRPPRSALDFFTEHKALFQ